MPVGADVRKALRRGSDVGGTLGRGVGGGGLRKKKRGEGRGMIGTAARGDVTLHAAQRAGARAGVSCDWSLVPPGRRSRRTRKASSKHSAFWLPPLPEDPPRHGCGCQQRSELIGALWVTLRLVVGSGCTLFAAVEPEIRTALWSCLRWKLVFGFSRGRFLRQVFGTD